VPRRRFLLLLFSLLGSEVLAGPGAVREDELKAAYIYNFAKFTRWNGVGDSGVPNPLVIGVLGDERVAESLAALTHGRTVGGSPIEVKSFGPNAIPANLHIVYVSASHEGSLTPALFQQGRLTIGETEDFLQRGGIIRLLVESDRLQFEIDNGHAQKACLTLSSQLLMLARRVN
jgi:hypothetical protein